MRKPLVLLFAAALSAQYCAADSWGYWSSSTFSAPAPAPQPVPTVNYNPAPSTTSPYNGFTAAGTPTTSYSGALTTVSSSSSGSWGAWGSVGQTATTVVSNTTTSGVTWAPQSTQPVMTTVASYGGGGGWGAWGGAVEIMSQPSSTPITQVPASLGGSTPSYAVSADNPEPGTILTLVGGMGALLLWRRRTMRKNAN
jgi:hypothetical protein